MTRLADLAEVVATGSCSSCGACALASGLGPAGLALDEGGQLRPIPEVIQGVRIPADACAGAMVDLGPAGAGGEVDPEFGHYRSAWRAWANDPEARHRGSSGGVISALSGWLLSSGHVANVVAASGGPGYSTVAISATTPQEAEATAGSRYAPCSTLAALRPGERQVLVGRPCEITAHRGLVRAGIAPALDLTISFFCAGVPSIRATERLMSSLGARAEDVTSLSYRGDGWPGRFVVRAGGEESDATYAMSWGGYLGRDVMWRCKLCADGVGLAADIAVADLWNLGPLGPVFDEAPGVSAVFARSTAAELLLRRAADAGIIHLDPLNIEQLRAGQPHQVLRRRTVWARVLGARLARAGAPRYRNGNLRRAALHHPVQAARAAVGTMRRRIL